MMPVRSLINIDDAQEVIKLVGEAAVVPGGIAAQKQFLVNGLLRLLKASIWLWPCIRIAPPQKVCAFKLLDGGYRDEEHRTAVLTAFSTEIDPTQPPMVELIRRGEPVTRVRSRFIHPEHWFGSEYYERFFKPTGLGDSLISVLPMSSPDCFSSPSFHRMADEPNYNLRELNLLHLVMTSVQWLHDDEMIPAATRPLMHITPREHQVLLFLMTGDSRKQIARRLKLSENTVNGYVDNIYRNFEVSSRGQLLARFLTAMGEG